jgi:hypothetical protein
LSVLNLVSDFIKCNHPIVSVSALAERYSAEARPIT